MLSFEIKGGTTVTETKRTDAISELMIRYDAGLKESVASRSMFVMYAACQAAELRGHSHFILLAQEAEGDAEDELVVGVTSNAADSIDTKKWRKYKGGLPLQELYSLPEMCSGLAKIYTPLRLDLVATDSAATGQ